MFAFERERVEKNVREASTPDLVDRVTAYRSGMEPDALEIIEAELRRRGVDWSNAETGTLIQEDGVALKCSFCHAPAVEQVWGWHWLWGKVPVFPRQIRYCRQHQRKPEKRCSEENGE